MKLYDKVRLLLEENKRLWDDDRELIWTVWENAGYVRGDMTITYKNFKLAPSTGSITRARRKIQEKHPELRSSEAVKRLRTTLERQKGTHVYRETIQEIFNW